MHAVNTATPGPETAAEALVRATFERLRGGDPAVHPMGRSQRVAALDRLLDGTRRWERRIAEAISADFGGRSRHETAMAEIYFLISHIRYTKRHLRRWMRPERRHVDAIFLPASNRVLYQPLGVVGVIAPWNYPFQLGVVPLASALAAGNRVMLKPSELTPRTADTIAEMMAELFAPELVGVVTGGPDVGAAFSRLPFDHLVFTGSTAVGRHVMRAAADNLTPVTLELGGKSPTILHPDFPLDRAVDRIASGKLLNAGQTCIAPDYLLCPADRVDAFVAAFSERVARIYPTLADNPDYTSIVNARHHRRLVDLLADARDKGARIVEVNPAREALSEAGRKLAPTLVTGVDDTMALMEEEIFGPILPIVPYGDLEDAIAYVNARPRPLALYYFDRDRRRARMVLERTISGGAALNDTMLHCAQDDLPFGGVGPSGLGAYHGREGFEAFSHKKAVFRQARLNATALLAPPYGPRLDKLLGLLIGRRRDP